MFHAITDPHIAAITKAYGNLLSKLEGKGLVTIAQTEREAIEAAAQARADKTGGDAEADQAVDAGPSMRPMVKLGSNKEHFSWNPSPRVLRHRVRSKRISRARANRSQAISRRGRSLVG